MSVHFNDRKSEQGMTLVELIIVIVILVMLIAAIGLKLGGKLNPAKEKIAQIAIADIEQALELYMVEVGNYPDSGVGLEALIENTNDSPNWHGPYLKKMPVDPWQHPYVYNYPGAHGLDYDLCSVGMDGIESSDDDICNWK
ncbi:MAG: type II secretion system major pseudopilin GspG [Acidobacteriota bacterium]